MQPIGSFISGQRLQLAELQDYVVDIIYDSFQPDALLYGGTAIWRCFNGMRFSEDIDIYMNDVPFKDFLSRLGKYGLRLLWQDPEFPTRVRIANNETDMLLESKPGYAENEIRTYFRIDGTTKTISVLSPTELMIRKMEAYEGRRFVRDIYDLYVLTNWLDRSDYVVTSRFSQFLHEIHKPIDEHILSSLLYAGRKDLDFDLMTDYIRRWLNEV
jgi:predicted nucleotidyltransferase component of viral defense system